MSTVPLTTIASMMIDAGSSPGSTIAMNGAEAMPMPNPMDPCSVAATKTGMANRMRTCASMSQETVAIIRLRAFFCCRRHRWPGSVASRNQAASMFAATVVITIATPGRTDCHHASVRY